MDNNITICVSRGNDTVDLRLNKQRVKLTLLQAKELRRLLGEAINDSGNHKFYMIEV
jgi:hypothetical protein